MKTSKFLLSTLVAAASAIVPAVATTSAFFAASAVLVQAENYTVTGTISGNGQDGRLTGTIDGVQTNVTLTANDTVTFNGAAGYLPWWSSSTFIANIILTDNGSTPALTINNGGSGSYQAYSGSISGTGTWYRNSGTANTCDYLFIGDVTAFKGNFKSDAQFNQGSSSIGNDSKGEGVLQFGAETATAYASSATVTDGVVKNISGTGSITTTSVLRYNYTGGGNEGTSALGINNSSISARYLEFKGEADYVVDSIVKGNNETASNNTLKISAGSATFNGSVSNFGNLNVVAEAEATFKGTVAGVTSITVGDGGILTLSGTSTFADAVTVSGALTLSGTSTFANTLTNTGTMTLNGDVSLSSAIQNSGTVSVGESVVFDLTNLTATDGVYTLVENGTITDGSDSSFGWTKLGYANFTKDGNALGRCELDVTTAGQLSVTELVAKTLVWNAGETGTWDNNNSTSWVEQDTTTTEKFYTGDSVVFNSDATVTVSGKVAPAAMSVNAATILAVEENETATVEVAPGSLTFGESGSLVLNSGVSLDLSSSATAGAAYAKIGGQGTVKLALTPTWTNKVSIGTENSFSGTATIASGWFTITNSNIGTGTYNLESGANFQTGGTATVANNIVFNGTHEFHANSGHTLTLSGEVTGADGSTVTKLGSGTVNFSGGVDLATFTASAGTTEFSGTGTNTIETLYITGGTTTISGTGTNTIETMYSKAGAITIGTGEENTVVSTTRLELGDIQSGTSTLTINDSATLKVTGAVNTWNAEGDYKNNSVVLGEWSISTTATISGALLAKDAEVGMGDRGATITLSGTLAAKGIGQGIPGKAANGEFNLTLVEGGKLILGESGMANTKTGGTVELNAGTIASYADTTSFARAMVLNNSETGTTFDTQKYKFADDGNSISRNEEDATGNTITVTGVLSGEGALIKTGAGTLTLSGANTYEGGTMISAGTLIAGSASALGDGDVVIASGAKLQANAAVVLSGDLVLTVSDSDKEGTGTGFISGDGSIAFADTEEDEFDLYVDISNLTLSDAESVALKIATSGTNLVLDDSNSILVGKWDEDAYWVESTEWKFSTFSDEGVLTLVAIPEPSAFGLLAGVGALALVAARRRRRS